MGEAVVQEPARQRPPDGGRGDVTTSACLPQPGEVRPGGLAETDHLPRRTTGGHPPARQKGRARVEGDAEPYREPDGISAGLVRGSGDRRAHVAHRSGCRGGETAGSRRRPRGSTRPAPIRRAMDDPLARTLSPPVSPDASAGSPRTPDGDIARTPRAIRSGISAASGRVSPVAVPHSRTEWGARYSSTEVSVKPA